MTTPSLSPYTVGLQLPSGGTRSTTRQQTLCESERQLVVTGRVAWTGEGGSL